MAKLRNDTATLDLLNWRPKEPPKSAPAAKPGGIGLADRISRAVADALREYDMPRDRIAAAMSDYLGEEVSAHMLNAYASQAKPDHRISYSRLIALAHVIGRPDLLEIGAEAVGCAVIDRRYLPAIQEAMLTDQREEIERQIQSLRRQWRGR